MKRRDHLEGNRLKRAAVIALALALLLTTLLGSLALNIESPHAVDEGSALSITLAGTGPLSITRDGTIVASGTGRISDTLQTNSSSAGVLQYTFANGTHDETRTVEVRDVPLTISVLSPGADITEAEPVFSLNTNWMPELCYVNIEGTSHTLQGDGKKFSGAFRVTDGVHTIDYKCKLGSETAVQSRTIHVDATAPKVTSATPAGDVVGPYATLSVDTDEIAQCRYGTLDVPYDDLPAPMGAIFAARNTVTLTLPEPGAYTYFVRCQDVHGNKMPRAAIISFLGRIPPNAIIKIKGDEPLKAGTYEVTLKTSTPLNAMPKLTYTFQESGRQHQVALTGSGDGWTGFLTIPADLTDTVVAFSFDGTSRDGVRGTTIASDSIFTVDAIPPKALDAISVDNSSSAIKLEWFTTTASDVSAYNIYRADHEGVSYTDLYTSTALTEFTDLGATAARYYYYRVAPVDFAGNIGPLSMEVYGSAVDKALEDQVQISADPVLMARLDEEIASMTAAMLDANATISALEQERNSVSIQIIKDMDLISNGREALTKMETATAILRELRTRSPTPAEVNEGIARSRELLGEARVLLIKRIVAQEQSETRQPGDPAGLERSVAYALIGHNLSAADRAAYLASATTLQDKITISVYASSFKLYDLNGAEQQYTFVRKHVLLQDPQNDITLVENIPKGFAADAGDITFRTTPVVLEPDPVIAYTFTVLEQQEYAYYVKKIVSLEEAKNTRTFLYPKVPEVAAPAPAQENLLTGQVTKIGIPGVQSTDGLLIIVGIMVIAGLGIYYVSLSTKPFNGLPAKPVPIMQRYVRRAPRAPRAPVAVPPTATIIRAPLNASAAEMVAPKEPTSESIQTMLQDSETAIDNKEYDAALSLYKDVLAYLEKDKGLQSILSGQTTQVYSKLLLFRRLSEANAALGQKDVAALRSALVDVQHIASEIGEEDTKLITEAKSSYAGFVRSLNALEIERVGKY